MPKRADVNLVFFALTPVPNLCSAAVWAKPPWIRDLEFELRSRGETQIEMKRKPLPTKLLLYPEDTDINMWCLWDCQNTQALFSVPLALGPGIWA